MKYISYIPLFIRIMWSINFVIIIIYLIITLLTYRPTADAALSQGKLHDCFLQEENLVTQLKCVLLQEYVPELFPLGRDNGGERF